MRTVVALCTLSLITPLIAAKKSLDVYFVDVEGGQATLVVTPSGQSLLIDTGWPGFSGRDAKRIVEAAKLGGVKKIDYVVITHHHVDHAGGALQLVEKIPVGTFMDKGPNIEPGARARELNELYEKATQQAKHVVVKAGDQIPLKGLDVKVVAANGKFIEPTGQKTTGCETAERKPDDPSENALSVGLLLTYGKFRMADLGDLTWNKEVELVCPQNRVGTVDVYVTTHHGLDASNAPPTVKALAPKVAIMNNGARKGGSPAAWSVISGVPNLDLWQLHYAIAGGEKSNAPETHIANLAEACDGKYIKLSAMADGSFTVYNSRNKFTRTYKP